MRSACVGIVGIGGLGSHIVQQLAFLGVRCFVLVDGDAVYVASPSRADWTPNARLGGLSIVVGYLSLLAIPNAIIVALLLPETRGLSLEAAAMEEAFEKSQ